MHETSRPRDADPTGGTKNSGGLPRVRPLLLLALWALAVALPLPPAASPAWAMSTQERIDQSALVIQEMSRQSDTGTMASMLRTAKGVVIFPSVVKAGFVFGGQYGEGLILRRDPRRNAWYGPSFVDIAGASWGLQIGIQSTALVLVITNERGIDGFTGDNVTLGGDLAIVAGPVGRDTSASTNLTASIYSYSMSKGLFAGIALSGATVDTKQDKNQEYWKRNLTSGRILKMRADDVRVQPLILALNKLLRQ